MLQKMKMRKWLGGVAVVALTIATVVGCGDDPAPLPPPVATGPVLPNQNCLPGQTVGPNGLPCNPYGPSYPGTPYGFPGYGPQMFNGGAYNFTNAYNPFGNIPYIWWGGSYNGTYGSYVSAQYYWYLMQQYYMQSTYYQQYGSNYWNFYQWYQQSPYYANTYLFQPGYGGYQPYPIGNYFNLYNNYYGYGPSNSFGLNFGLNYSSN